MASSKETIAYLTEQLEQRIDVRTRAMFGEYAVYVEDKVVAFVCDDQLFLKITPGTTELVHDTSEVGPPYPGAKYYYVIGEDAWVDVDYLAELVIRCAADLPKPKPKKSRSTKRG